MWSNAIAVGSPEGQSLEQQRNQPWGISGRFNHYRFDMNRDLMAMTQREVQAIVVTASGCGSTVKEYGHLLAHDPAYRDKAARIAALARDLSEVIPLESIPERSGLARIAFHSPCSLQHGQQLRGTTEALLARAGFELAPVPDAHLCCGSAGTYSILQPALSQELRGRKLAALQSGLPVGIVTANVGCLVHLQGGAGVPVAHWVELLDEAWQG